MRFQCLKDIKCLHVIVVVRDVLVDVVDEVQRVRGRGVQNVSSENIDIDNTLITV